MHGRWMSVESCHLGEGLLLLLLLLLLLWGRGHLGCSLELSCIGQVLDRGGGSQGLLRLHHHHHHLLLLQLWRALVEKGLGLRMWRVGAVHLRVLLLCASASREHCAWAGKHGRGWWIHAHSGGHARCRPHCHLSRGRVARHHLGLRHELRSTGVTAGAAADG